MDTGDQHIVQIMIWTDLVILSIVQKTQNHSLHS